MTVTITFIEQTTRGVPDNYKDLSIPEDGKLEDIKEVRDSVTLMKYNKETKKCDTEVTEQLIPRRCTFRSLESRNSYGRPFPCVELGNLYMIWVEERGEWIGFEYYEKSDYEVYWSDHTVYLKGPFKLNDVCARLIQQACNRPDVSLEDILKTSPEELGHLEGSGTE